MTHSEPGSKLAKQKKGKTAKSVIGRISGIYDSSKGGFGFADATNDFTSFTTRCIEDCINIKYRDATFIFSILGFADFPARRFPENADLRCKIRDQIDEAVAKIADGCASSYLIGQDDSYSIIFSNKLHLPQYTISHVKFAVDVSANIGHRMSEESPEELGPRNGFDNDRHKLLDTLFTELPDEPNARVDAVVDLQRDFRERVVKELQPPINAILRNPPTMFSEKQALATKINLAFQKLGIAAREQGSTQPCSIVAHRSQSTMETGWLKLQTKKPPQLRSKPTSKLEKIELIEAVREEGFGQSR